jgi:molybdopterin-guanine dinucleotide biosynthesis protein A
VLAGGISRRFGGDKLSASIDGRPVIDRLVARVAPIASQIVVATSSASRQATLKRALSRAVDFCLDRTERWGTGPAAAMAGALEQWGNGPVLFVPGDIPWIETRALRRFVSLASEGRSDVAAPFWAGGETENLLQWHRSHGVLRYLPWTNSAPRSSRRASEFLRAAPRTLLVPVHELSNRPGSFSHVTTRQDLESPSLRGRFDRSSVILEVAGTPKRWYRTAQTARSSRDYGSATRAFRAESRWYERNGLALLARHSSDDAAEAVRSDLGRHEMVS